MSDPATFAAFGAIMLVIALLCVAIDWFGKPLKHRKFVPKIYRFPEERQPRGSSIRPTEWSDAAFVLPVAPAGAPPVRATVASRPAATLGPGEAAPAPGSTLAPDTAGSPVSVFGSPTDASGSPASASGSPASASGSSHDVVDLPTGAVSLVDSEDEPVVVAPPPLPPRDRGWKPGGFVFNLTDDGGEPSPQLVRERYWRNVAATSGAAMFGDDNVERMIAGRPPRRRNPRTGEVESMTLPAVGFRDAAGRTPVPSWPDDSIDPFVG